MNVSAKINFDMNVDIVDSQISFTEYLFSASSEICIPKESDSASAIAIIIIPPIITNVECVVEFNPTIKPKVVIIPDVRPNPKPFLIDNFIIIV